MFITGFDYVINKLKPKTVIVYGRMPDRIFNLAKMHYFLEKSTRLSAFFVF